MKLTWTKPSILVLLGFLAWGAIIEWGLIETAAVIIILGFFLQIYTFWSRKLPSDSLVDDGSSENR